MKTSNSHSSNLEKDKNINKHKAKSNEKRSCKKKINLDDSLILRDFLSPQHQKLQQLNLKQRNIIQKQFQKMIRGIKKNSGNKNKCFNSQSSKEQHGFKTKKLQCSSEIYNNKTVRKVNLTERRHRNNQLSQLSQRMKLSPDNKNKKIKFDENSSLFRQTDEMFAMKDIGKDLKSKTSHKKNHIVNNTQNDKLLTKRKKTYNEGSKKSRRNFYLMENNFFTLDQTTANLIFQEMKRQQQDSLNNSTLKVDYQNQFHSSSYIKQSKSDENCENQLNQQNIYDKMQIDKLQAQMNHNLIQQPKTVKNNQLFLEYEEANSVELSSIQTFSPHRNTPQKREINECIVQQTQNNNNMIDIRIRAINVQMKTSSQFLQNLYHNKKLDRSQYQKYLDLIMIQYDKELTQAQNLKCLIDENKNRIQGIVNKTKQIVNLAQRINDYKKQNQEQIYKQLSQAFHLQNNQDIGSNKNQAQLIFQQSNKIQHENQIAQFNNSAYIQDRIATQIGLKKIDGIPIVNSSVLGIFQFLKKIYHYILTNHLKQLLKYINMPYGYNIQQRLTYMQGYQGQIDEENQMGIIYGIQEVLSLDIFQNYWNEIQNSNNHKLDFQKSHSRAIFDGINQAINEYRPYYYLNGPPYPWTFSEKTLTFFYVSQQNIEQVLEKVQLQILKWGSTLCGLIVPQLIECQQIQKIGQQEKQLDLNQIFMEYTQKVHQSLIQQRQEKVMKNEKSEIDGKNYEWQIFDQQKTAILLEISSLILEQLSNEASLLIFQKYYSMQNGHSFTNFL